MNLRIKRLESEMMREISLLLQTEVKNRTLKSVVITGCNITNDLSFAKVYYTILGDETLEERNEIALEIRHAAKFIRGQLSNRIDMRHTPEIKFVYDQSIEYGDMIERKINEIHKNDK